MEKCGRARQVTDVNIMRCMRFACWIIKATNTHSEYLILTAFLRQQWLCERSSILRLYVYFLSYVLKLSRRQKPKSPRAGSLVRRCIKSTFWDTGSVPETPDVTNLMRLFTREKFIEICLSCYDWSDLSSYILKRYFMSESKWATDHEQVIYISTSARLFSPV